ncbi:MAG: polysaccharide biosynthesis protein [Planctomycetota bacterium]
MPGTTAILIGTPQSVASVRCQLAFLAGTSREVWPCGCIVLGGGDPARAGIESLGELGQLPDIARWHRAELAIVSLPASMTAERSRAVEAITKAGLNVRFIPTIDDVLSDEAPAVGGRGRSDVDVPALIGRTPRPGDPRRLDAVLRSRRVLITGAGGSIGSELARIAASRSPSELVLVERSENALFEIDREIGERFPGVNRRAVLHDIVDESGTRELFEAVRPDVVFHAAAHKHVPLMEEHPAHALVNNFFGTRSVADAAVAAGASRFVLISSDKAVNPSSVMGATKRLAERYVQGLQPHSPGTRLSMVRFGNVLGSSCSVLPIWSSQLAAGRPITVTDERMTRYFMTIPEAASLVIQSASIESAVEDPARVFVLDMGEPVSIAGLARSFVRAHGLEPSGVITFIGARPGEKLYEELAYDAEQLVPTAIEGVNSWAQAGEARADLDAMVRDLSVARSVSGPASKAAALESIRRHVPEMSPAMVRRSPAAPKPTRVVHPHQTVQPAAPIPGDAAA